MSIRFKNSCDSNVESPVYRIHIPLLKAFLSFWNADGHTVITKMGETGINLLHMRDMIGLPITGLPYDEYIPEKYESPHLVMMYRAYAYMYRASKDNKVAMDDWIAYYVEEKPSALVEDPSGRKRNWELYADPSRPMGTLEPLTEKEGVLMAM